LWARIAVLVLLVAAGTRFSALAPLHTFSLAYLLQLLGVAAVGITRNSTLYTRAAALHFGWSELLLSSSLLLAMIPAYLWCSRRPQQFFLARGNLSAGLSANSRGPRWSSIAPAFALVSALCAWLFVHFTGAPGQHLWTMIPVAILLAAINAFQEEFLNRNLLVGAVQADFGPVHAIAVSAFIFGIGHWNGLPAGVIGVLMTLALGAATGLAMVQTKGLLWPWFMHFVPDCVLAYYWGIGSVAHATIGNGVSGNLK
jgi:membrane protease YdiL (CAAX protease family)